MTLVKPTGILKKLLKRLGILSTVKSESEEIYILKAVEKRGDQVESYQEVNNNKNLAHESYFQGITLLSHKISK
ncbi:MAG: hypothetical protein GF311_21800 [Candidatus Lokiarchaeota archaeon]|nr:hypothetical protein [Candidatus Lokiarchaeota archaeon]